MSSNPTTSSTRWNNNKPHADLDVIADGTSCPAARWAFRHIVIIVVVLQLLAGARTGEPRLPLAQLVVQAEILTVYSSVRPLGGTAAQEAEFQTSPLGCWPSPWSMPTEVDQAGSLY